VIRKMRVVSAVLLAVLVPLAVPGCGGEDGPAEGAGDSVSVADGGAPPEQVPAQSPERPLQEGFIRARHILVSWDGCGVRGVTRSRDEAAQLVGELQARLASGEATFEQLAFQYSDCTTAPDSGMLPDFSRGAMVAEFEDAAFALEVGETSDVVETAFGFHLIKRVL